MKKVPFTPEGVKQKQEEINTLNPDERLRISDSIASDSTAWIMDNFEMTDEQIAYLKGLERVDSRIMGWSLAIGTLGQIPIEMQDTTPPAAARGKKKKEVSVSASTTTNPETGNTTVTGTVGIKWIW